MVATVSILSTQEAEAGGLGFEASLPSFEEVKGVRVMAQWLRAIDALVENQC